MEAAQTVPKEKKSPLRKSTAKKPRSMRAGDKVRVVEGVAKDKVGKISSVDKDMPPELRYFVIPSGRNGSNEDLQVMGRFSSAQLERV